MSPREGHPQPCGKVSIADSETGHVSLVMVGDKPGSRADLDYLILDEQSPIDRADLEDCGIGIAGIAGPSPPFGNINPYIHTLCLSLGNRIGKNNGCSEQDVRIGVVADEAPPIGDIQSENTSHVLRHAYFKGVLSLGLNVGTSCPFRGDEGR